MFWFLKQVEKQIKKKGKQKSADLVSNRCHDKTITSAPFSASIACANEAAITDYHNYMTDKT